MLPMTGAPAGSPSSPRTDPLTDRGRNRRVSIPLITTRIPRVPGETFGEAAEVTQCQDVILEPIGRKTLDEGAYQAFQAAIVELVHHMKNSEASRHRPEDRMTNPFSDKPEGMFSRGTAQRFTRVDGNHPPPRASAAV